MNKKNDICSLNKLRQIKKVLDIANLSGFLYLYFFSNKYNEYNSNIAFTFILLSIVYFFGRFINNRKILAFYHVIWAFMMILTPITSYDKYILFFHLSLILLTLATRKIFNGCIVRNLESNNENITNNSFTKLFNWDLIFPILGFISNYKLFTLDTININ